MTQIAGNDRYVLAVDLGTGGPKVALVSTSGDVVGHEYEHNELIILPDGGVEQDPDEWWTTVVTATRRLLARQLVPVDDIVAVCVTAQWFCTIPVDADGRHLSNSISWMDTRGAPHARRAAGGGVEIPTLGYNARKARAWLQRTGGIPSLTGKDAAGHILLLKHEFPEIYAAAHAFLEPPDWFNARMTGRIAATYDTVTSYWVTDNRDLDHVRYDDELIGWLGIDRAKLPPLVPTGSVIGNLTPEVAAELGLGGHVQVVAGMGDTLSAGIGSGAVRDLEGHLYIGTSSWLSCHVPFKKTDIFSNITSLPSAIPGRYWVATEQDTAGKCITWLIENLLYPDDALSDPAHPGGGDHDVLGAGGTPGKVSGITNPRVPADVLDRLNAAAAAAPPGANGVMFFPWLNGERTPVDDHHIRAAFFNARLDTTRADLVRAVFEGVALNTRWMNRAAEKFVKQPFEHINFVGGGANSPLWCQIMADVLGRPIRKVRHPVLANARGAGLAAAVALGHLDWSDIPARIEIEETYLPDRTLTARYDELFDVFTRYYRSTKGLYARANRRREHR